MLSQKAILEVLKEKDPGGRYYLKLDATDVTPALQASMRHVWNGDVDLSDGTLGVLRTEYD